MLLNEYTHGMSCLKKLKEGVYCAVRAEKTCSGVKLSL